MQNEQLVNWKKTLNNIIWNHKYDDVIFKIKEMEDLHSYIKRLEVKNKTLEEKISVLTKRKQAIAFKMPRKRFK